MEVAPKVVKAPSPCHNIEIVSLFAGAGGLDLGFKQAGFKIGLAIDSSEAAVMTHKANFPRAKSYAKDLLRLGPAGVLRYVSKTVAVGQRIGVIGGPPCQGFSRANTQAQTNDPRNKLPSLYLRIVRKLQTRYTVEFVVFENVLGIRDQRHSKVYEALVSGLERLGFDVTEKELCALDFGVPQTRRRIVLSGLRAGRNHIEVRPRKCHTGATTVRDVIGGLKKPVFFKFGADPSKFPVHPNHWTMQPKSTRFLEPKTADMDVFAPDPGH
ncbi:DNA (cytosine-5)-methyltransferase 1 [Enhydrobacter aerosaccus]|uniref:DNA (cytosine-5-)-methyltransferase n=2 Tax=Enhydrobacter aerosaccus TaxID=225324 RepID=A0A1T4LMK1_9HYPH|nr:DNA (cytosine-5)-methyltransferase 1 [Enhydrobacter aerosaccus]